MSSYKELLTEIKKYDKNSMNRIAITTISNLTLEPFLNPCLDQVFYSENIAPTVKNIPYQEYQSHVAKEVITNSDIVIVWLNCYNLFSDFENNIYSKTICSEQYITKVNQIMIELLQYIQKFSFAQILWISFEDYGSQMYHVIGNQFVCSGIIDMFNFRMACIIEEHAILLDLKRIIALLGVNNVFDKKMQYSWDYPYSKELSSAIAREILVQYHISCSHTKKCIVLDLDNVLWGGVLSEIGMEHLKLGEMGEGKCYKDFQRFLLTLYYMGVILTVCSKNDLEDVLSVFRLHNEMVLKEEHISVFQVNWDNKAENINTISKKLNIDLNAMVFIDDTPFEVEMVKNYLPKVTTILFHKYMDFKQFELFYLSSNIDLKKIKQRNETYQCDERRKTLQSSMSDHDDFIEMLDMSILIQSATIMEYNRISELSYRTNKCTNGKRYTISQLKNQADQKDYKLYSVYVKDKFSDLGMVGAIGVQRDCLDLFCLSCRALGRQVEENMMQFLQKEYPVKRFDFIETSKNAELCNYLQNKISKTMEEMRK